jgi:hypothetical protein
MWDSVAEDGLKAQLVTSQMARRTECNSSTQQSSSWEDDSRSGCDATLPRSGNALNSVPTSDMTTIILTFQDFSQSLPSKQPGQSLDYITPVSFPIPCNLQFIGTLTFAATVNTC